jgi:hypothetical protein
MAEQANWWFCQRCHAMFFGGYGGGRCPAGGTHSAQGFNFVLPHDVPESPNAQRGWRFCQNCHAMFFEGYGGGRCATGSTHSAQGANFVLPHDVDGIATAQQGWRFCQKCHSMFFEGYGGGRCTVGGTHSAQGANFVLPHRTDSSIPPDNPLGRAGIDTKDPQQMFTRIIGNAEYYGLPVGFLRAVGKQYDLKIIKENEIQYTTTTWIHNIHLHRSDFDSLLDMNAGKPVGGGPQISTLYHESTHAYLDMKKADAEFKRFIDDGLAYYKDAPLRDGSTGTDPERLLTEAAATYVGHRTSTWWGALEFLTIITVGIATGENRNLGKAKIFANKSRDEYDSYMRERVFGYEMHGGEQVETSRQITAPMKEFLDSKILEDKIPDAFGDNPKLVKLYFDIIHQK